jgi:hypothetical protein
VVHDASSSNTSFTLAPQGTQNLTADVYDTNNQYAHLGLVVDCDGRGGHRHHRQ